jgi:CHAT domain-containing protein
VERPGHAAALLVADPVEELPSARLESARFGAALGAAGMVVRRLEGREALHDAVRRALVAPDVTLFHYAGHARFEGRDGWESALPLAAGGWLTLGDVLALERVPPRVVLSGCDTARAADGEFAVGLGLAQAFLLAGAEQVLAASRPVADSAAATIMAEILLPDAEGGDRGLAGDPDPGDLARRLARAQARLAARGDGSDWAAFRALVR